MSLYTTRHMVPEQLHEIRNLLPRFPFGADWSLKVLLKFRDFLSRIHNNFPESQIDRETLPRWFETYAAFKEWSEWDHLTWLAHNEEIRRKTMQLMQASKLNEEYCNSWRTEVFVYIRNMASKWRRMRRTDSLRNERQICIDVLYGFIEDGIISFHLQSDWRQYLVDLCQKTSISPKKFLLRLDDVSKTQGVLPLVNGVSASVFHGKYDGREVAIKDFRLYTKTINATKKRATKESIILCLLRHPNIVPFIGIMDRPHQFWLVSGWMPNGDITQYTKAHPYVPKNELLEQVADGLDFLRQYNVIHGDLKGSNVLVDENGKARIADFGSSFIQDLNLVPYVAPAISAKIRADCQLALKEVGLPEANSNYTVSSTLASFSGAGTGRWMSPERLVPEFYGKTSAKPTLESDVFSFGMLMYQVYSGKIPYHDTNNHKAMANIINGVRPQRPTDAMSEEIWLLAEECWSQDVVDRPVIVDAYNRLAVVGLF